MMKPIADESASRPPARERLLNAAGDGFLVDEYHQATTRAIAEIAGANVAMIRYCFGSREGLYEAMIVRTLV